MTLAQTQAPNESRSQDSSEHWLPGTSPMSPTTNVLISGGARGIGRCLARHLLQKEHRLFILDIDEDELDYTVAIHLAAVANKDRIGSAVCDLRDPVSIRTAVRTAAEWFGGRIDVVINNGGIADPHWKGGVAMDDPDTLDQFTAYMEVNLRAPFVVSQAAIPYMKVKVAAKEDDSWSSPDSGTASQTKPETHDTPADNSPGPSIINVSSFRAHMSDPDQEGYAASKGGLLSLTHSMAVSCGRWGIRVNAVSPGRVKVLHESREGDEKGESAVFSEKDREDHAVNRAGRPEDVARAVEYLMGAGFVTGQEVVVDGGAVVQKG